jgi:phage terminase large subunit
MSSATQALNIWSGFKADNPAQIAFLKSDAKYRLLSSGRGGGKSVVGCRETIRTVYENPGSRNLVARFHYSDLERSTHATFKETLRAIGLEPNRDYRFNQQQVDETVRKEVIESDGVEGHDSTAADADVDATDRTRSAALGPWWIAS